MFGKIAAALLLSFAAFAAYAQDKVVYHFDGGLSQATKGLRNIRNHLDTDSKAKIVAVAHAEGVDFLMEGAKTTNNQEFAALVGDLMARGVTFEAAPHLIHKHDSGVEEWMAFFPDPDGQLLALMSQVPPAG